MLRPVERREFEILLCAAEVCRVAQVVVNRSLITDQPDTRAAQHIRALQQQFFNPQTYLSLLRHSQDNSPPPTQVTQTLRQLPAQDRAAIDI
jgi:hypothetical protein